jgi:5-formyltetrahydrofolate cyclo-ligase
MNSAELKRAKRVVRDRVLAAREAVPQEERARLGAEVVRRFLVLPEVAAAGTVLAFWSFGSEVPTAPLIEGLHRRGVSVALPRIVAGDIEARTYRPGDQMTATSFGAFEPAEGAVVEPAVFDAIAVPAVAFDHEGRRVGYGGGFYDRFLPRTRVDTCRIGLAFEVQLLPEGEALPAGSFDERVDLVVTEASTVRSDRTSRRPAERPT